MPPLRDGDIFGEIALLLNCSRTATVKTKMYSLVASLKRNDFDTICRIVYAFYSMLKNKMKTYNDNYRLFQKEIIRSIDYMANLNDDSVDEISYCLKQVDFEKDKILFRAGDVADCIYFIASGHVQISAN
jgi:cGMP-dependent protein kinase